MSKTKENKKIDLSVFHNHRKEKRQHWDEGSENGNKWFVDFKSEIMQWVVTVEKYDGTILREQFSCYHEPRFGVDILDSHKIEEILEKFLK